MNEESVAARSRLVLLYSSPIPVVSISALCYVTDMMAHLYLKYIKYVHELDS